MSDFNPVNIKDDITQLNSILFKKHLTKGEIAQDEQSFLFQNHTRFQVYKLYSGFYSDVFIEDYSLISHKLNAQFWHLYMYVFLFTRHNSKIIVRNYFNCTK